MLYIGQELRTGEQTLFPELQQTTKVIGMITKIIRVTWADYRSYRGHTKVIRVTWADYQSNQGHTKVFRVIPKLSGSPGLITKVIRVTWAEYQSYRGHTKVFQSRTRVTWADYQSYRGHLG